MRGPVWLEGDLLVPGPAADADVVVWKTPWPPTDGASRNAQDRVLVVPSIGESPTLGGRAALKIRPYAALITDSAPIPWKGRGVVGPVVRLDSDLFRRGDRARVEGITPRVELPDMEESPVVTSFLEAFDGRILLLRRSKQVGSFQGRWAGVSGYLESESAERQAYQEIEEETGLTSRSLHLQRAGRTVYVRDGRRVFSVHPFRFRTDALQIQLDWEHTESEWVDPLEISRRKTVPKLDRAWREVRPEGNR